MGNKSMSLSVSTPLGPVCFSMKAANADDQQKIKAFIGAAGFEHTKALVDSNEKLREALESTNCAFPQWEAELPEWFDALTPEQGAAVVAAVVTEGENDEGVE